jgi:hypothetical protein
MDVALPIHAVLATAIHKNLQRALRVAFETYSPLISAGQRRVARHTLFETTQLGVFRLR